MPGSHPSKFCRLGQHCPYQHLMAIRLWAHPPPSWKETKNSFFLYVKALRKRKVVLPLRLSHLHNPGSISLHLLMLHFCLSNLSLILACQPKKKQIFHLYKQRKFGLLTKFLNENKKYLSTNAEKELVYTVNPFTIARFQTSYAHSIREISL